MDVNPRINVAITGTLSEPRSKAAEQINSTFNGLFVENINLHTHYLVCEKHDSKKARKAALYGTAVISEAELRKMLSLSVFPSVALPTYAVHRPNNFPEIEWTDIYETPSIGVLTYQDSDGNYSIRTIAATAIGVSGDHAWLGAYDGPDFKTFRKDRIVSLEPLNSK